MRGWGGFGSARWGELMTMANRRCPVLRAAEVFDRDRPSAEFDIC